MSHSVNEIAKRAIASLAKSGTLLTPENYELEYEKIAAMMGAGSLRQQRLDAYAQRLSGPLKIACKSAKPRTEAELISFLIARLNEAKSSPSASAVGVGGGGESAECARAKEEKKSALMLAKALLSLISESAKEAERSFGAQLLAALNANSADITAVKNSAVAQISELKDAAQAARSLAARSGLSGDLEADAAAFCAAQAAAKEAADGLGAVCALIAPVLAFSLTPSIASEENTLIFSEKSALIERPDMLREEAAPAHFSELVKKRIELDRAEISSSHKMLDELLGEVGQRVEKILSMATSSEEKISKICEEISQMKADGPELQMIKQRLLEVVMSLQSELGSLREQTLADVGQLGDLQRKVSGLQQEIEKLREESQQDFLTQLSNKRHLDEQLAAAEDSYERYGINYSLVFFDIDHFKQINDSFGHKAGDAILAGIGNIIAQNCRKLDTAGRWGGEEFMLILPHTDTTSAAILAERIREQVSAHKFIYKKQLINVRISGGVAERSAVYDASQLVEAADKLLYAAKAAGRDQIRTE